MCLPFTNQHWKGEINFSNRGLSLLANSLEQILYEALHNEIGLDRSKEEGLASLGIKARKVEFVQPPTLAFNWNALIIRSKYFLITVQQIR